MPGGPKRWRAPRRLLFLCLIALTLVGARPTDGWANRRARTDGGRADSGQRSRDDSRADSRLDRPANPLRRGSTSAAEKPTPSKRKERAERRRTRDSERAPKEKEIGLFRAFFWEAPRLTIQAARKHPKLLWRSTFVGGTKHVLESIRNHKLAFFGGLALVSAVGGLAHAFHLAVEPLIISASMSLLALQARDVVRHIRRNGLEGESAAEALGERYLMPMILVNGATAAGVGVTLAGGTGAEGSLASRFATGATANGLIGGDSPAVAAAILQGRDAEHSQGKTEGNERKKRERRGRRTVGEATGE